MSFIKSVLDAVGIITGSKEKNKIEEIIEKVRGTSMNITKAVEKLNENNEDLLELTRKLVVTNPQLSHTLASYVGSNRKALLELKQSFGLIPKNVQEKLQEAVSELTPHKEQPYGMSSYLTKKDRDNDLIKGRIG